MFNLDAEILINMVQIIQNMKVHGCWGELMNEMASGCLPDLLYLSLDIKMKFPARLIIGNHLKPLKKAEKVANLIS